MPKKVSEEARMLRELQTAESLNSYGVMSKKDMARMRALCVTPPVYTPDRVVAVRTNVAKMTAART